MVYLRPKTGLLTNFSSLFANSNIKYESVLRTNLGVDVSIEGVDWEWNWSGLTCEE